MNLCKTCGTICPFDDERTECGAYAPLTNENWFISLPTEEKADLLFGTFYLAGRNDEKNGVWKGVDTIMEWLKQPHT